MQTTTMYVKRFSSLDGLQGQEEIVYNLSTSEKYGLPSYGIEVESKKGEGVRKFSIKDVSTSRDGTKNILTYLYENAVKIDTAMDVVYDIISS